MTYEVINQTVLKTQQGTVALSPGQLIDLTPEKAFKLVELNKIKLVDGLEEYRNPKKQYNLLLKQARQIEQDFKSGRIILNEREKRIAVYRAIIEALDSLLREIEPVGHEDALRGFKLLH